MRTHQRGFSLVELMVGLTLGLIMTSALLVIFANASTSGQNLRRSSVQLDNGRYAAELLRDDIRLAGFYGEIGTAAAVSADPDPCSTAPVAFTSVPPTVPPAVRGYTGGQLLGCLAHRQPDTAAIVIRRLDIDAVLPGTLAAGSQYYVQYSFCESDTLAPSLLYDRIPANFNLKDRTCAAPNRVRAFVSRIYFIASCNRCAGGGDGMPTLKRLELLNGQLVETALVEGIEHMRFEYGFDLDGNGTPDSYLTQPALLGPAADWANVMAVKLHFVSRSLEKAAGSETLASAQSFDFGGAGVHNVARDGYVRRAHGNTIRLVNPSGTRELP
ncbi:MAG TPA: PilW family protein [Caldimonas sp.]|nr:PilW family protein [Caldimonas sp.]HEX2539948.1 PilW family protein [Caldimonas sp.]